jgi:limonene-1,2-epoxide hydrolase
MGAQRVVEAFITAWNERDYEGVINMLTDDIEYHNMPMPILNGKEAVRSFLDALGDPDEINWQLHHIAVNGSVVLTERTDNFSYGDKLISLPVMGTFEVKGGKIAKWRDYFDLAQFTEQMAAISQ